MLKAEDKMHKLVAKICILAAALRATCNFRLSHTLRQMAQCPWRSSFHKYNVGNFKSQMNFRRISNTKYGLKTYKNEDNSAKTPRLGGGLSATPSPWRFGEEYLNSISTVILVNIGRMF